MICLPCRRSFHYECEHFIETDESASCCCPEPTEEAAIADDTPVEFDEVKRHGNTKDEIGTSAGRKRAAQLYKINPEVACDWQMLANCGGGLRPIVGCITGKQRDRHHGPIKDTSHNEVGNVHRICSRCHNLWHAKNDEIYNEETYAGLPHAPRAPTSEEILSVGGS